MNTATSNATPAQLTLLDAMKDPVIFGPWFESKTWRAWRVFFRALFGLKMGPRSLEIYPKHTGRTVPPEQPSKEAWLVVGRRGGKSRCAALVAVFLACFRVYRPLLAPGERGTVMVIAADRKQARVIFRYIVGFLEAVPLLGRW
jgi:hypothetical protein